MKKFFYRALVIALAVGMLTPSWITKAWTPTKAEAAVAVATVAATNITASDATLNGINGSTAADGHSFWISKIAFNVSSPTIPYGVYSTPDLGPVAADSSFSAQLSSITTAGLPVNLTSVEPDTTYYFAAWTKIGSTWNPGDVLNFKTDKSGMLEKEDFGVVNYNTGHGILKGYTAGFGLSDATFEGATSIVVQLYAADNQLLQTNTGIMARINADVTGAKISSPFDVSGSFDYVSDGYWANVREVEYGQSKPATKVVATVALENGKVVKAENTSPSGEASILFPPNMPLATPPAGQYQKVQVVELSSTDVSTEIIPEIYYTLDGSNPAEKANKYVAPLLIDESLLLKAIAFDSDGNKSSVLIAQYEIAPTITHESVIEVSANSATITWSTDHPATSRVVYDTVSHSTLGSDVNYGYAFSTAEDSSLVLSHSVIITGLTPGVKYYFRTVSHGSPEAVSSEYSLTTTKPTVTTAVAVVETPVSQPATPPSIVQNPEPTIQPEQPIEQGEIKGTESDEEDTSEDINWTPWIILFILIILAGAATGGYFYWFGKDEEEEIVSSQVIEEKTKKTDKAPKKKVTSVKKKNRW